MTKKKTPKKTVRAAGKAAKNKIDKLNGMTAAQRVKKILPVLKKTYPNAKTSLIFKNPLELLVATILSAQCTDKRVNIVTKDVFKKYELASDWANADVKDIETDIKSTGFYRNKAKNIKNACSVIAHKYQNKVPDNIRDLLELPGVGRKTANVILANAFGEQTITCDTHVIRLSRRLGLSKYEDPVKLEFDLAKIIQKNKWTIFSHLLIFHGRNICKARKADCENCPIAKYCPAADKPDLR